MFTVRMLHRKAITVLGLLAAEAGIEVSDMLELPVPVFLRLLKETREAREARRVS